MNEMLLEKSVKLATGRRALRQGFVFLGGAPTFRGGKQTQTERGVCLRQELGWIVCACGMAGADVFVVLRHVWNNPREDVALGVAQL